MTIYRYNCRLIDVIYVNEWSTNFDKRPHRFRTCRPAARRIFGGLTARVDWLGLRVGGHPALSLHSSDEPGELSQ